jgi:iron complex outermembrane receptor protein
MSGKGLQKMMLRKYKFALFVGASLLSTTHAFAQDGGDAGASAQNQAANDESMQEVVITAQRRTERLQNVPIAVSAFTDEDISNRQINNTLDLINYVPNLIGHNNTALGTANTYSMRGLANTESISTFDPPIGTYVDDIYISRQGANNFALFDVERIEVLRGPQGTLFGRNTTGGAINVIMRKPGNDFGGYLDVGYGRFDRVQVRGSVDVPVVTDRLLTKVSGYYIRADGYVDNLVTGQRLNGEENWGLRGAVRAFLSDSVRWDVSADYVSNSNANLPNFYDAETGRRISFTPLRTDQSLGTALVSEGLADIPLGNTANSWSVSSNLEVEAGAATINFITGYRNLRQEYMTESFGGISSATARFDGVNFLGGNRGTATPLVNDSRHRQFSQEIKVTGEAFNDFLTYVAGFYYINETNDTNFANLSLPLVGQPTVNGDRLMSNDTEAFAGYFQGDFHLTDRLTFTAGIRYTDERKDIAFSPNPNPLPRAAPRNQPFDTQDVIDAGIPVELRSRVWTPRFAIQYQANPDLMFFASATRGFKSGGWNSRAYFPEGAAAFTRETLWSFEGGVRSEFFDRRLRVNLTGFYFNDQDTQLPGGGLDPVTGTITYLTRNVADLRNYGLEAEISARPVRGLNLYWSVGLQNASYRNINQITLDQQARCLAGIVANNCNAGIITPDGQIAEPTRAPSFTSTVGVNYELQLGGGYTLQPAVNWNYISDTWVATSNDPRGFQKAHSIVNGGITLRSPDRWSLAVECNNCFDDTYITSFLIYPYLNAPGSWMVRLRYDF